MINEKGITLVSLVVTIVLLGILMAVMTNVTMYNGIIEKKFETQNSYNELMNNVEENIDSIQEQWGNVLSL